MTKYGNHKTLIFATSITFFQIYTILQTKNASETEETQISDHDKNDHDKSDDQKHMDKYIDSETNMEKTSGHVWNQSSLNGYIPSQIVCFPLFIRKYMYLAM